MYRQIYQDLQEWKDSTTRTPLILRGARQVGKTYTVERFAEKNFANYIKINFELDRDYKNYFKSNLDTHKFLAALSLDNNITIIPGKILIFFDEIQECPEALQALRYFYEELPQLHIIAAGSLLEFTLNSDKFKMPVGRISFKFLRPLSFYEFLQAQNKGQLIDYIKNLQGQSDEIIHKRLLKELDLYYLVGGMPMAVKTFVNHAKDMDLGLGKVREVHHRLLQTYKRDFGKYANASRHDDLEAMLDYIPKSISSKFKYSHVYEGANSRNMKLAFDLLDKAGLCTKIQRANNDMPLGASASIKHFKTLFLDIGLMNSACDLDLDSFLLEDAGHNKFNGVIAEQFVGQELLNSFPAYQEAKLYYWENTNAGGSAEIDYLIAHKAQIYPLEVKAGTTGKLKSLHYYMKNYKTDLGLRISNKKLEQDNDILSIPLYAVAEIKRLIG